MSVSILGYIVSADPFETSAVNEQAAAIRHAAQQMGTDVTQTYIVPFSTVETTRSATALAKENGWAIGGSVSRRRVSLCWERRNDYHLQRP
jgi:hypothetical protein